MYVKNGEKAAKQGFCTRKWGLSSLRKKNIRKWEGKMTYLVGGRKRTRVCEKGTMGGTGRREGRET